MDVVVVPLALLAGVFGWRHGLAAALLSFVGVLGGAVVGVRLGPVLAQHLASPGSRVALSIGLVVLGVAVGQLAGAFFGRRIRARITAERGLRVDSALGAVAQAVTVVLAAWLVVLPLASASFPGLGIRTDGVEGGLDSVLAGSPSTLRELPDELRALRDSSGGFSPAAVQTSTRLPEVTAPDLALASSSAVTEASTRVLHVVGTAQRCSLRRDGTGWVVAPERVATNAHVVAAANEVHVDVQGRTLPATVVSFDPKVDVAVLAVPGLGLDPLRLAPRPAMPSDDAVVVGYPLAGPLRADPARIRGRIDLSTPDLYGVATVVRDAYELRGSVRQGNSGGPLLAPDGTVYGMVFGVPADRADTGMVLTAQQISPMLQAARTLTDPVPTGPCTPGA